MRNSHRGEPDALTAHVRFWEGAELNRPSPSFMLRLRERARSTHPAMPIGRFLMSKPPGGNRVILAARQRRTASKLKLRSHTFRPSTIFLLKVFVATVLWYLKSSAEDRRLRLSLSGLRRSVSQRLRATTQRVWFNTASMKYGVRSQDLAPYLAI